ncbi:hypothetical protein AHiyo8_pII70300 (plasmid) [Arthrobacter sp. Hiyo8]|nr:hypothetical protein AHiyo8_pII70210 [Arthrobacter sp. Hiyo8]BAS18725.1 hypothetical protein AHiyo8_pII70300 [Arthrobacter sp. Hiyo8]
MNRDEALAWFDARYRTQKSQRKLVNLAVHEVSAVDEPAHGAPGWIVMKSAGTHRHNPAFSYLTEAEEKTAAMLYGVGPDTLRKSSTTAVPNGVIGRDGCGCLYLSTAQTVAKAEAQAAREMYEAEQPRAWSDTLTPEQVAYLMTPELNLSGTLIDLKLSGLDPASRPDVP